MPPVCSHVAHAGMRPWQQPWSRQLDSAFASLYHERPNPRPHAESRAHLDLQQGHSPLNHNQRVGKWGEQRAAEYLGERGYDVAARNVRTPHGEIDLIARKHGLTIFIEVKTRLSESSDPPETAVTGRKQSHMMASAEYYAQEHELDHWRIDVIAVQQIAGEIEVRHFENAVG